MEEKYRVRETPSGSFIVEKYTYKYVGFWRRSKEFDWYSCNDCGGLVAYNLRTFDHPMQVLAEYNTLNEARQAIKRFKQGTVYHTDGKE